MTAKKLTLNLDFHSGLPIYTQIVAQVQSQLANGVLQPGDQLPTVRALAEELRVNFNTIARAYRLLDEARVISTQQGRGTYITEIPPPKVGKKMKAEVLLALAERFINEAQRLGFSEPEIGQMVRTQLQLRKEAEEKSKE
ncbi:MAG: GntR family transcriptional regulator [Anaerolineales bacterium]|nr:GntR family transcriptional regulator [Anaerolineales bacterium]